MDPHKGLSNAVPDWSARVETYGANILEERKLTPDRAWWADVPRLERGLSVHDDDYLIRVDRAWWADVPRLEMGLSVHDDEYLIRVDRARLADVLPRDGSLCA